MTATNLTKYIVSGRIPGDDDDTVAEVSVEGAESPVDVFIERILYDGDIPDDWKSRPPNILENRYREWAYIQSVTESSQDSDEESGLTERLSKFASLPPHNPARFKTTDGMDNPRCNNGMRAAFARDALEKFQQSCQMTEDVDIAAADLIGDLFHLVHASGHQPLSILESAFDHFLAEAGDLP